MAAQPITERQSYWLNHINAVDAADESTVDYAKRQGLKVKDLYQWKTRLTKLGLYQAGQTVAEFIAVKPISSSPSTEQSSRSLCALVFPSGIRFEFEGSISPGMIRTVVETAREFD